jgi:site-specific DNA-methyltransferase (adenine-specific)
MPEVTLHQGDCLAVLPTIADASIDLILTDPPYFKVKMGEAWDRQWKTPAEYLDWIGRLCSEWRRVLKPNGSLYCFASPRMAARVECKIGEHFEVLNSIVWAKPDPSSSINYGPGNGGRICKETMRSFYPNTERIIFAEQPGADSMALGESGYAAQCERLRGFVFEPILRYLQAEFSAARISRREVDEHFGTANVSQYWLQARGFIIPTAEKWAGLRSLRPQHFRREYEDLRREYEDLRRPFSVSADVPYTDVWDFPTVSSRPGKHVCEKPEALLSHMIAASSRPGAVVLDCFAGSGATGSAAVKLGRKFIGVEADPRWFAAARARIEAARSALPLAVA